MPEIHGSSQPGALMYLDARDCRLIDAVAEDGSLTRAGQRLNITQPALSRHLRDLEERLRLTLFNRTGRRMVLTAAGQRMRIHARDVLEALSRAESDAQALAGRKPEQLRICTECYTCYHWLPRVLTRFTQMHPGCDVTVVAEVTRRPLSALLEEQVDLALVSDATRDKRLKFQPVFDDEFVALVGTMHPWAGRDSVTPKDFADQHVLLIAPPEHSTLLNDFLKPAGVKPRRISEVMLSEAALAMAESGYGVAPLPRWAAAPQVRAGTVVPLRLGKAGLYRQWSIATRRTDQRARHIADFATLVSRMAPGEVIYAGSRT